MSHAQLSKASINQIKLKVFILPYFSVIPMTCWVVSQFKKRTLSFPEPALNTSFLPRSISTPTSSGTIVPSSPFRPLCSELFSTAIPHLHIFAVSPISKRHILIIANITMAKMQQFFKIPPRIFFSALTKETVCMFHKSGHYVSVHTRVFGLPQLRHRHIMPFQELCRKHAF